MSQIQGETQNEGNSSPTLIWTGVKLNLRTLFPQDRQIRRDQVYEVVDIIDPSMKDKTLTKKTLSHW